MARSKLGNDPFRRGAADRQKPPKGSKKTARSEPLEADSQPPAASPPIEAAPAEPVVASPGEHEPIDVPFSPVVTGTAPVVAPEVSDVITPETEPASGEAIELTPAGPVSPVDDFGRDSAFAQRALGALEPIYRHYFRVEAQGLENVPSNGPVILVANHSGAVPWDVAMLTASTALEHPTRRQLRPLIEDFLFHFPFIGTALNRLGAVRACQENAEALLGAGHAIAVFPEGVKGLGKSFRKRYRLQRFGRGGFVKLALRTGAPIVPVAIVGAEETHPVLARLVRPAAALGLPFVPVTPTFPWLGALGLVPLPTKWTIEFGTPIKLDAGPSPDELSIERLTEEVRSGIQGQLDRLLRTRRGLFI